mgnify:CR=1 FL=1
MATNSRAAATVPSESVSVRLTGDAEASLNKFISNIREKALRSATYAGAKILYEELSRRVQTVTPNLYEAKTGQLERAIYHWHDDKKSGANKQVYAIGVNKVKAPHWHLIEYGHWQIYTVYQGSDGKYYTMKVNGQPVMSRNPTRVQAYPYIRPTWDSTGAKALEAVKNKMSDKLKEL